MWMENRFALALQSNFNGENQELWKIFAAHELEFGSRT